MNSDAIPEQRLLQHLIVDAVEACLSHLRGQRGRARRALTTREEYEYNLQALREVDSSLLEAAGFQNVPLVMKTVRAIVNGDALPVPARRNGGNGRRRSQEVDAESQ